MNERIRRHASLERRSSGGDLGSYFSAPAEGQVTVSHGPYSEGLPVAGQTVAEIRDRFRDRFGIDPESLPAVDGRAADEHTVVRDGQQLAFIRNGGEKGLR